MDRRKFSPNSSDKRQVGYRTSFLVNLILYYKATSIVLGAAHVRSTMQDVVTAALFANVYRRVTSSHFPVQYFPNLTLGFKLETAKVMGFMQPLTSHSG